MTRQTKANLISTLLHGLIVAAILSMPQPEAARKPALELDFHIMETQPALTFVPGPAAEAKAEVKTEEPVAAPPAPPTPVPEEQREPQPVPIPAPEKPKKAVVKPKVRAAKPDPVPPPEPQAVATQPRESLPLGETAAGPATDVGAPSLPPAASSLAAKGDHAAGPSASQAGVGAAPLHDVTFGQGSGPSFAKRILPGYPWQARRLGRKGKVVLRLHISARGTLENVEIVESGGLLFDEASLQAARASSYRPAMVQGTPVASTALLPVKFNLKNDDEGGG